MILVLYSLSQPRPEPAPGHQDLRVDHRLLMDLPMSDLQEGVGAYQTVSTGICGTHKSSPPSTV